MPYPKKLFMICLTLIGVVIFAMGCTPETVIETVEVEVTVEVIKEVTKEVIVTEIVEIMVTPEPGAIQEIPYEDLWASSGHADTEAEAFRHWDEDDPVAVPANCAKCHSSTGYQDFLGLDGSEFGVVDADHDIAYDGISCVACHNDVTASLDSVVMPSGAELLGLGDEARCMQCHQGRSSKVSVDGKVTELGLEDEDATHEELGFINIHYYAAAATKYGTAAQGGYEYDGKTYDANFAHVDGFTTCIGCHNSHTLEVKVDTCVGCHEDMETAEDFMNVRMAGSMVDYDGDGDMEEGIYYEIEGVREALYQAIQAYASDVAGAPIIYDSHAYPYFFIDTDGNGEADEGEANYGNKYATWTPRLVKAAYNFQVSNKDTGAYAHGGKYIIQLLYDSIEDLDANLVAGLHRTDHGHFAGSEEAFRHWDEDGEVSASCSKCHSAEGLPFYFAEGVTITQDPSNGFQCATCHAEVGGEFPLYEVTEVTFPSGATIDSEHSDPQTLVCMNCHQGRSSKASVDKAVAGLELDAVPENSIRFINVHYFAAGATRYGTDVQGAYEYEGKEYVGFFEHDPESRSCVDCHNSHELEVQPEACSECHEEVTSQATITAVRVPNTPDYDGDGDVTEGFAGEVETMREALYAAILAYASTEDGMDAIIYGSHAYPYFFIDTNGNGTSDPGEAIYPNQYATWTPRLLQSAYNYQYAAKDPGAFTHNGKYTLQILYDSIQDLGGDVSTMTRP